MPTSRPGAAKCANSGTLDPLVQQQSGVVRGLAASLLVDCARREVWAAAVRAGYAG